MTLTIANGLIQDDFLGDVPILKRIVTSQGGANNVRTHLPLEGPIGVTIHNTGNSDPSSDALAHASWLTNVEAQDALYIGAHFFVDGQRIVQTLPINEISWHAGDGMGKGNAATISIEICETSPYERAEANAMALAAALMDTYNLTNLYTHEIWSGKYCPRLILVREGGWDSFVDGVARIRAAETMPPMAAPVLDNTPSPWAQDAVDWALANRFLVGDETGNFRLHTAPTREELLAILHRMATKKEA